MTFFNPKPSPASRLPLRRTVWSFLAGLVAVIAIVLGVSWWWAGVGAVEGAHRLGKIGAPIAWVAGRLVQGDFNALSAAWQDQRRRVRWLRIEGVARAGMQLTLEGRYAEAEATLRGELGLDEDLPQIDRRILWMRENLGIALIAQGKYSAAATVYRETADLLPAAAWAHIPKWQNLAALLHSMSPVSDKAALELASWGLEQSVKNFGEDDPTTQGFRAKIEQLGGRSEPSLRTQASQQ